MRSGLRFWAEEPAHAIGLAAKKLLWTVSDTELPNTDDPQWVASRSWVFGLRVLPLRFGVMLPLAAMGALLAYRRRRAWPPLAGVAAIALVPCVVFFTNSRFRAPLIVPLVTLAGCALAHLSRRESYRGRSQVLVLAALGVAGLAVAFVDPLGVRAYRIGEIDVNTGLCEEKDGRLGAAVESLREGLARTPDDATAVLHLIDDLEALGRADDAVSTFRRYGHVIPSDGEAGRFKVAFAQRHGLPDAE